MLSAEYVGYARYVELDHLKVCVRLFRIKYFITVHEESQLLLAFDSVAENTVFLKCFLKTLSASFTVLEGNTCPAYLD